jgi:hypothetical protein
MATVLKNASGQSWNGNGFGGGEKVFTTMDQLNNEVPKIAPTGYKGRVVAVPQGCSITETPILDFEV